MVNIPDLPKRRTERRALGIVVHAIKAARGADALAVAEAREGVAHDVDDVGVADLVVRAAVGLGAEAEGAGAGGVGADVLLDVLLVGRPAAPVDDRVVVRRQLADHLLAVGRQRGLVVVRLVLERGLPAEVHRPPVLVDARPGDGAFAARPDRRLHVVG